MTYSTFLFDLDGTLIDSVRLIIESYQHALDTFGHERLPDDKLTILMGIPLADAMKTLAVSADEANRMVRCYREYNLAHHDAMVRSYPGVKSTLVKLKNKERRLGVVTSKLSHDAWRGLQLTGLAALLDVVVGADDVSRGKPDPEPVQKALRQLGAGAQAAVMVGDSPHDMRAGRAAGVHTAAALWGPFDRTLLEREGPDHWLSTIQEVAQL